METVETDLYVFCSDSFLLKKIQRLVFMEEAGELRFSMSQLLPMPSGFSGVPNYQIYGHHWRELFWGVTVDKNEFHKEIRENSFQVSYATTNIPADNWFYCFYKMVERLYWSSEIYPEPELVILYAHGIFDTREQGFVHWEPGMEFKYEDMLTEESKFRLRQFFPHSDSCISAKRVRSRKSHTRYHKRCRHRP